MKVLLIGGTSLIGPHVVQELLAARADVATVTRSGISFFTEKSFACDRNDEALLLQVVLEYSPDVIVDMIPFTKKQAESLTGIIAKTNKNMRVVALSSTDVYGAYAQLRGTEQPGYQPCPLGEDALVRTAYGPEGAGYDKLGVEHVYLTALEHVTLLRLPAVYGWPDTTRIDDFLLPMLRKSPTIAMSRAAMEWKCSRILHKNAAFAVLLAVRSAQSGRHVYNVAEEEAYTLREWCLTIAAVCGWQGAIVEDESTYADADYRQHLYVSTNKIREELQYYEKYDPADGLRETIFFSAYRHLNKPYHKEY